MDPTVVAAWIAAGVSALTLIGTLVAQYLGYRATSRDADRTVGEQRKQLDQTFAEQNQQLDRTLTEQREQLDRTLGEQRTRTMNERFATSAEQLGSDKPAVRLAGVYAMAGLADDWEENRQTCVDVLCAYLRMPYEPDPGQGAPQPALLAFQASREVRHTVIRVIAGHLRRDATVSWRAHDLDFRGTVFDGGDFSGAMFGVGQSVKFDEAIFSGGRVYFASAEFSGAVVTFIRSKFVDGSVIFSSAKFSSGLLIFSAEFSGGDISFSGAEFLGASVSFLSGTEFCGSRIDFTYADFSSDGVTFIGAKFTGGEVDFSEVAGWSKPPKFPWTDTPPSGVKLPYTSGA
jgi:uncharacterized protein YjbI with pentapeptide repeats